MLAAERRNHFTGIMIGTTCGVIFIVLSVVAVFHTRKLRIQRAQSRRSEVASTASFDVHQASAPPSYDTGIGSGPNNDPCGQHLTVSLPTAQHKI